MPAVTDSVVSIRDAGRIGPQVKKAFGGVSIANEGLTQESVDPVLAAGEANAVAFGRLFPANPELPERFRLKAALNSPHPETFYGKGARGYTDYPCPEVVKVPAREQAVNRIT